MTAADLGRAISVPAGSVSRLEAEAKRMDVPMMYFFENSPVSLPSDLGHAPRPETVEEAVRFIDAYFKIDDPKVRRDILGLLKAVA